MLALDLRGHGRSAMPRDASVDENLSLMARFIEREAGRSVTLVGNSMGGLLSMLLAASRPDLVESLVLVNPALPWTYARRVDPLVATMFGIYSVPGVGELYLDKVLGRVDPERSVGQMMALCGAHPRSMDPAVMAEHVDLARHRTRTMPWRHRAFLTAARSVIRRVMSPWGLRARAAPGEGAHPAAPRRARPAGPRGLGAGRRLAPPGLDLR